MNPDEERLIELSIHPLADNAELRLSAEAELRKAIEAHAADRPEIVAEAVESLARADRHPCRRRWRIALVVVTALVSLPLLAHSAWQFFQLNKGFPLFTFLGPLGTPDSKFRHLDPQQKLLLFGDSHAADESGKWKPLWESQPDNPAYLAAYAMAYFSDHSRLSPEILAAAGRVDPDNAWFPALAAAGNAQGAVTKDSLSSKKYPPGKKPAPVWKINDAKRLADALSAIHQLVEKPRFTGYQIDLLRQRIPLFPPRRDMLSQLPSIVYVSAQSAPSVRFRLLADVLAAGAQQCAVSGDVAGFRQIVADWRIFAEANIRNSEFLIDALVGKSIFNSPLANFRDTARALGLEEEANHFASLHDQAQQEKEAREKRGKAVNPSEDFVARHGSVLVGLTMPMAGRQVKAPPILTEKDLRPARYADHALFERFCTWPAWLLLLHCACLAAGARHRQSPLARGLSARMVDLLRPSDWLWMVAGGVVFPVLWYFLITRLTPLGAREWSARMSMFIQPGGQFGCMTISMIILPVLIASWRLAKRGAMFGLAGHFQCLGWLAAAVALAGVPVFGGVLFPGSTGRIFQNSAYVLAGLAGTWLFGGLALNVMGRGSQALRRATLARIVWPMWVLGMLVLVALIPFHYAEEQRWVRQDEIFKISAESPGPNRYEYDVTQILRKELLEMIAQSGNLH